MPMKGRKNMTRKKDIFTIRSMWPSGNGFSDLGVWHNKNGGISLDISATDSGRIDLNEHETMLLMEWLKHKPRKPVDKEVK